MDAVKTDTLLALRAGRLFDGERRHGPSTVLIGAGRAIDIDSTTAEPPPGAQLIDLGSDVCLLPGLIDAHVHLAFDASADVVSSINALDDGQLLTRMAQAARQALLAGITTVRDLGDRSFLALALREQLDTWVDLGPQIIAAGPPITIRGGHCHFLGGAADGRHELRAAVRERAERGCEVVKVMVSGGVLTPGSAVHEARYDLDDLRLIVKEAHDLGLRAAAYVHGPGAIADAIAAGFDTLEHVTFFTPDGVAAGPATMDAIIESGVVVSATVGTVPAKENHRSSLPAALQRCSRTSLGCNRVVPASFPAPTGGWARRSRTMCSPTGSPTSPGSG